MIYLAIFLLSSVVCYLGETKRKEIRVSSYIICVVTLSIFAAIRSPEVGIDVKTYVLPSAEIARNCSDFASFLTQIADDLRTKDLEPLFLAVTYIAVKLTNSGNAALFAYEMIITSAVITSLNLVRIYVNNQYGEGRGNHIVSVGMLCFDLLLFNTSLNVIRQSMACALALLGILCILLKKNISGMILLLSSVLVHNTAMFSAVIAACILLYLKSRRVAQYLFITVFILCLFGRIIYFPLMTVLSRVLPISLRYLSYEYMTSIEPDINLAWLFLVVMTVIRQVLIALSEGEDEDKCDKAFAAVVTLSAAMFPLSIVLADAGRILYYLFYFMPALLAKPKDLLINIKLFNKSKKIEIDFQHLMAMGVAICFIYWVGTTGLNDSMGTAIYQIRFF